MTVSNACYVGIDVSMDWLDVCLAVPDHWSGTSRQPANKSERFPAIGPVVAATLVTEMPELGTMSPKQTAALAGLAPHHNESGKTKGKSSIYGGRSCIRAALYMAALVAMRYNPVMKETYKRLVANGKPKKLALTAIMRKLIVVANQIIKNNQIWKSDYALNA